MNDNLVPHEDMIGQYDTPTADATNIVKDVLLRFNISLDDCHGQCYDRASVMQGIRNRVATEILSDQPKALFTHVTGIL